MKIHSVHIASLILVILLMTTPHSAMGRYEDDSKLPNVKMTMNYRAGMQIESDRLGEFIAKSLKVEFGNVDTESISVKLRVEVISREKRVIGAYDSRVADCLPKHYYPGTTWIRDPGEVNERLAPGFGDRRKITVGKMVVINHEEQYVARECGNATHAMQITLMSNDRKASGLPTGKRQVCLTVER